MKKLFGFLFLGLLISNSHAAGIIAIPAHVSVEAKPVSTTSTLLQKMDVKEFLALTPAKWKEISGKKLSLPQRLSLKMAQKQVKRQLKKGQSADMAVVASKAAWGDNFHWGAFLLAMFLGPIGVLIVYLVQFEDPEVARKSAWRGLIAWVALAALVARLIVGF